MSPSPSRPHLHLSHMGCAQGKPSRGSPARSDGLDRLMRDNAYRPAGASRLSDPRLPAAAEEPEKKTAPGDDDAAPATPLPPPRREKEQLVDGWPTWLLDNVPREALRGIVPKSADAYDKIDKVGQGTYSNVYKARERGTTTGRVVALKKVRFDTSESESVRFMAREMRILQRLDHPNVIRLEGIATSRMHRSIYLVFDFMYSDLARIIARAGHRLTEPQIKCYMQQLLSGLQHCHERGILHRDIKGSNLLIDRHGVLKIGDFGLANDYGGTRRRPLTSRVVTLWYRAPELLLGSTDYGVGIDLWSAGCLLAEMFFGKPLMPARTEIEQLYRIFSLCGSPPDDYWRKHKVSATYRPTKAYRSTMAERLRDLPPSARGLITTLLALDPAARGTAARALQSDFFSTPPLPCELSSLPVVYKEEEEEEVADDASTSHDGRKPKPRQRSHRRKDTRPKAEEQQQQQEDDDEPKNNREEDRVTDAAKSGNESVQVLLPRPQEEASPVAAPQDQPLPTASRRHRRSGGDEDHRPPLSDDQAGGEPSFVVRDRSLDDGRASVTTDYDAAVATLRGSGELPSKQCVVLVDHV